VPLLGIDIPDSARANTPCDRLLLLRERPGDASNFSLMISETSSTLELDVYILLRFSLTCKYVNLEQAQYI
jgi:hypothetical protein